MNTRTVWSLVGVVCVLLLPTGAFSQEDLWDTHITAAVEANQEGNYAEAEKQYIAALEEAEKFEKGDPRLARTLNGLALLYHTRGRYAEAEPLYQRALPIYEKALGPQHRFVAAVLKNLAFLYYNEGKYEEAEPLYQRALEIDEKALGPEDPSVAYTLKNLALLYQAQDQYAEAERFYKQILATWENASGLGQSVFMEILENYADLLREMGRPEQATEMKARAEAIRTQQGGGR